MKRISVIVPCYNSAKYIKRCIESLINNITDEIEIIFIDDKSTDNTLNILKEYSKNIKNITVLENTNNIKQSKTRDKGVKKASGDWIVFVDADDYVVNNYYEILLNYVNSKNDLVLFNYNFINERNQIKYTYLGNKFKKDNFYLYKCNPTPWNKMYKKDVLENLPLFETFGEDVAIWPSIIDKVKDNYTISKDVIYNYVENPTSVTKKINNDNRNDYYKNFSFIFEHNKKNDGLLFYAWHHLMISQVIDLDNQDSNKTIYNNKSKDFLANYFGNNWEKNKILKTYKKELKIVAIKKRMYKIINRSKKYDNNNN